MLLSYNPFYLQSIRNSLKINQKYSNFAEQLGIFQDKIILRSINRSEDIIIVIRQSKIQGQHEFSHPTTNFIQINSHIIVIYEIQKQKLTIVNLNNNQISTVEVKTQFDDNKSYHLHYFAENQLIALVEKNVSSLKVKFFYYRFNAETETCEEMKVYQSQSLQWDSKSGINASDSCGTFSWASLQRQTLQIVQLNAFSGFKTMDVLLEIDTQIFSTGKFTIGTIWTNKENIFLSLKATEKDIVLSNKSLFSPVIIVKKQKNSLIAEYLEIKMPREDAVLIQDVILLRDYCIFRAKQKQSKSAKSFIYVFSKELKTIVKEEEVSYNEKICLSYKTNFFTQSRVKQNDNQLEIVQKSIKRKSSIACQSLFNILSKASHLSSKVPNAIIIFGAEKSGKTTLRHYLAGHKLIHRYNDELGYSQVVNTSKEEEHMEHEDISKIIWMSEAKNAIIFDIPDCNDQSHISYTEICFLLANVYGYFKKVQFVITIPLEYIDDSQKNEQMISFIVKLIQTQQKSDISSQISIVLTKIQDPQSCLQSFKERIEEITELNQSIGELTQSISQGQRLLVFQNKEIHQGDGAQLLQSLLKFQQISYDKKTPLQIERVLTQKLQNYRIILSEADYIVETMNEYLRFFSSKIVKSNFINLQYFYDSFITTKNQSASLQEQIFTNTQGSAFILLKIILKLKKCTKTSLDQIPGLLNAINELLIQICKQLSQSVKFQFQKYILPGFIFLIKWSLQSKSRSNFLPILQDPEKGFLNNGLSNLFQRLKVFETVSNSAEKNELSQMLGIKSTKKKIIRVEVPMTYEQEKQFVLKKKSKQGITFIIGQLPQNAMKLDLMMDQIKKLMKKKPLQSADYVLLKYYIRQSSRICQYHQLYIESLTFSLVIPDFYSIQQTIQEFVKDCKSKNGFQAKILFNVEQKDFLDQLMTIARECLRDRIAQKLIYINALAEETSVKTIKSKAVQTKNKQFEQLSNQDKISIYKEKLQNRSIKCFYNLENDFFTKMMDNQKSLVQDCIRYENDAATKDTFERYETIGHVLDRLPVST